MEIRICKFNSGFFSEIFGDTFWLVSGVLPNKKRGTGEWQRGGTGVWNVHLKHWQHSLEMPFFIALMVVLKPLSLALWLLHLGWLILLYFFHNQSCSPGTFTHASKWRVRAKLVRGTVLKGMVVPCKPMRLQSVPQRSESGCNQILFSLSLI